MSPLDKPIDPGNAYVSMRGDGQFAYAAICNGKRHYTNSWKRLKKHYRAARKRKLEGTWFYWDASWGPGRFVWWRIRLSENAL